MTVGSDGAFMEIDADYVLIGAVEVECAIVIDDIGIGSRIG